VGMYVFPYIFAQSSFCVYILTYIHTGFPCGCVCIHVYVRGVYILVCIYLRICTQSLDGCVCGYVYTHRDCMCLCSYICVGTQSCMFGVYLRIGTRSLNGCVYMGKFGKALRMKLFKFKKLSLFVRSHTFYF